MSEEMDYSVLYQPKRTVCRQKMAAKRHLMCRRSSLRWGKSAYRALTMRKFTDAEKRQICQDVIDKVDGMDTSRIPIPVMHNIVESALRMCEACCGEELS